MKIHQEEPICDEEEDFDGPSHNPSAPSDELFDISTTVDPSYVISLIRNLIPINVTSKKDSDSDNQRQNVENLGEYLSTWEESGCVLWDLAASKAHADLMVENLLLEVLSANLTVQRSVRVIEISLGIIGNLACHEAPMKRIISTNGLVELIVSQLFLDDTQCLCETCRLLSLGLRSSESRIWASTLQSENALNRILWFSENSLNPKLIEKSVELLLDIIESSDEVVCSLLQPLIKMGLASLLISLLDCEITNLRTEQIPERLPILDVILRAFEAISVIDCHSQEISSNKKLFRLVCELVKLPDKAEVANSCVTAAILIANILSDVPTFLSEEISSDLTFLQGLFDIFPFASDDLEARSAIWNIMARLLAQVHENEMSPLTLSQYVTLLASKSDLIEDDLLDHQLDGVKSTARIAALNRIISVLNRWTASRDDTEKTDVDVDINRLLNCCLREKLS